VLENLFGLLGLDLCALYSGLHELEAHNTSSRSVAGTPASTPINSDKKASSAALQLDASKVAALREDSARVSALLGSVFSESDPDESQEPPAIHTEEQSEPCLLDLDADHAGLATAEVN
jgi:TerB-C domain